MSVRWQITRINIQKPGDSPDCLLGVVPQLTDSRLSETKTCPYLALLKELDTLQPRVEEGLTLHGSRNWTHSSQVLRKDSPCMAQGTGHTPARC